MYAFLVLSLYRSLSETDSDQQPVASVTIYLGGTNDGGAKGPEPVLEREGSREGAPSPV